MHPELRFRLTPPGLTALTDAGNMVNSMYGRRTARSPNRRRPRLPAAQLRAPERAPDGSHHREQRVCLQQPLFTVSEHGSVVFPTVPDR